MSSTPAALTARKRIIKKMKMFLTSGDETRELACNLLLDYADRSVLADMMAVGRDLKWFTKKDLADLPSLVCDVTPLTITAQRKFARWHKHALKWEAQREAKYAAMKKKSAEDDNSEQEESSEDNSDQEEPNESDE
jgi:hypothetical protein